MDGGKILEASHPPETEPRVFSPPERQVGILRTIVQPSASLMQTGSAQFTQGRAVRPQPIRDDRIRPGVALPQFPEEFQSGLAVSLLRDKGLQYLAFLVHGTPQAMAFAIDFHEHLIKVPPPSRQRTHSTCPLLAELGGKDRAKTVPPEPDRFPPHRRGWTRPPL